MKLTKILITVLVLSASLNADTIENKFYYEKYDKNNHTASQKKVNATYLYGLSITKDVLTLLKDSQKLSKVKLQEECNESLFLSLFEESIIEEMNQKDTFKTFTKDCKRLVDTLY